MELMLRFCDAGVGVADVFSGELRTTVSVFLPAPLAAQAGGLGGPEELPRLDTRFGRGLVGQLHPIRRSRIREQKTRPRR